METLERPDVTTGPAEAEYPPVRQDLTERLHLELRKREAEIRLAELRAAESMERAHAKRTSISALLAVLGVAAAAAATFIGSIGSGAGGVLYLISGFLLVWAISVTKRGTHPFAS